jgi:hypothetical protein
MRRSGNMKQGGLMAEQAFLELAAEEKKEIL